MAKGGRAVPLKETKQFERVAKNMKRKSMKKKVQKIFFVARPSCALVYVASPWTEIKKQEKGSGKGWLSGAISKKQKTALEVRRCCQICEKKMYLFYATRKNLGLLFCKISDNA